MLDRVGKKYEDSFLQRVDPSIPPYLPHCFK